LPSAWFAEAIFDLVDEGSALYSPASAPGTLLFQ
jgi:hypothetical protein